jgi:hypothetical protein
MGLRGVDALIDLLICIIGWDLDKFTGVFKRDKIVSVEI